MIKILISLVLLLSIYSCKNNSKSKIQSANSNLQDTSNNLYFKDSLDTDTIYATPSLYKYPDSVNLFFQNADDTLWSYVMRSYTRSDKKGVFLLDSFKSILNEAGYNLSTSNDSLFGTKKQFNKRYNFQLRLGDEITLITYFEYWFKNERYLSPMIRHDH